MVGLHPHNGLVDFLANHTFALVLVAVAVFALASFLVLMMRDDAEEEQRDAEQN